MEKGRYGAACLSQCVAFKGYSPALVSLGIVPATSKTISQPNHTIPLVRKVPSPMVMEKRGSMSLKNISRLSGSKLLITLLVAIALLYSLPAQADDSISNTKTEMNLMKDSCAAISPPTAESGHCLRACGMGRSVVRTGADPALVKQAVTSCRTAHKNAGAAAIELPATPDIDIETLREALMAEARDKEAACRGVSPSTSISENCRRQCLAAFSRGGLTIPKTHERLKQAIVQCRTAYTEAGF
jgi:hypothetical protein